MGQPGCVSDLGGGWDWGDRSSFSSKRRFLIAVNTPLVLCQLGEGRAGARSRRREPEVPVGRPDSGRVSDCQLPLSPLLLGSRLPCPILPSPRDRPATRAGALLKIPSLAMAGSRRDSESKHYSNGVTMKLSNKGREYGTEQHCSPR
jgi:hypothetical protein